MGGLQQPITVAEALTEIEQRRYLLPAIQREFVWSQRQVAALFDSIMRGYPIGSFLFWQVGKDRRGDYQFYEFIRDYHEKDNAHNQPAAHDGDGLTAVLDGQQRLTALYIGLMGSYAARQKGKWWNNPSAFPKRRLYLDLLHEDEDWDGGFSFRFLTDDEATATDAHHWFRVGQVMSFTGLLDINKYLIAAAIADNLFASEALIGLYESLVTRPIIPYFLEKAPDLDKVLNIFIRMNSGGTPLSYSDLLLSVATAQWEKGNAREQINTLVDELNGMSGQGFAFDKDLILKASLVLTDHGDIRFKVTNFTSKTADQIEKEWGTISLALRRAVELAASFGFNGQTLTSNNSIIPIAYYLLKRDLLHVNYTEKNVYATDRLVVRKWLLTSLLKGIYGDAADTLLSAIREVLSHADLSAGFPIETLVTRLVTMNKSVRFEPEEIDALLYSGYGQRRTFSILAVLYPSLDYGHHFHQDHVVPRALLTRKRFAKIGVPDEDVAFALEHVNDLPNLQLLEGIPNQEKSDLPLDGWLKKAFPDPSAQAAFKERNYIPDVPATPECFREFYAARRLLMLNRLQDVLGH